MKNARMELVLIGVEFMNAFSRRYGPNFNTVLTDGGQQFATEIPAKVVHYSRMFLITQNFGRQACN